MKDQLHFSSNWNGKLSFSKSFTTIRLHNHEKYKPGNVLEIYQNGRHMNDAEVVDRKRFYLKDMNNFMALLDTGYPLDEAKKLIKSFYSNVKPSPEQALYDFVLLKWMSYETIQTKLL